MKFSIKYVIVFSIAIILGVTSMADDHKLIIEISDTQYSVLELAKSEFKEKINNRNGYIYSLSESPNEYLVTIEHEKKNKGQRGSPENHPGLVIYIDKSTMKITRSHFIR